LAIETLEKFLGKDPHKTQNKFNTHIEREDKEKWNEFIVSKEYKALKPEREKFSRVLEKSGAFKGDMYGKASVFTIDKHVPVYALRKGDKIYLDGIHHDHLEWFDKEGNAKGVLNLEGFIDLSKSISSLEQQRTMQSKFVPAMSRSPEMREKIAAQKAFGSALEGKYVSTAQ